jgi:hypothetical protein
MWSILTVWLLLRTYQVLVQVRVESVCSYYMLVYITIRSQAMGNMFTRQSSGLINIQACIFHY